MAPECAAGAPRTFVMLTSLPHCYSSNLASSLRHPPAGWTAPRCSRCCWTPRTATPPSTRPRPLRACTRSSRGRTSPLSSPSRSSSRGAAAAARDDSSSVGMTHRMTRPLRGRGSGAAQGVVRQQRGGCGYWLPEGGGRPPPRSRTGSPAGVWSRGLGPRARRGGAGGSSSSAGAACSAAASGRGH